MICRQWRGWATHDNAPKYQRILTEEVVPSIEARRIPGFRRIIMLRRDVGNEIEFSTIMWWDSLEAIKGFVGDDIEAVHVPPAAHAVLSRYDQKATHYEVFGERDQ